MTKTLLLRECLIVLACAGVGLPLAVRLPIASRAIRVGIAPAIGFALLVTVLLTLNFLTPLRWLGWPIAVLALAGGAWGLRRLWLEGAIAWRTPRTIALACAAVTVLAAAAGPFNSTLRERHTTGPIAVGVFDAPAYLEFSTGYGENATRQLLLGEAVSDTSSPHLDWSDADRPPWGDPWDLPVGTAAAWVFQHSGAFTVSASLAPVLGLPGWEATTVLVGALLMMLALGAAAAAAFFAGGPLARAAAGAEATAWWTPAFAAVAAGAVAVGAATLSVTYDGSWALIAFTALLPPLAIATCLLAERPTTWRALAVGALLAAVQTVYPEMLPSLAFAGIALLIALAIAHRRTLRRDARPALVASAIVIASALLLAPRATGWTLGYLVPQALGDAGAWGIDYRLPTGGVTSWMTGTTDFYSFAFSGQAPGVVRSVVLPLALAGALVAAAVVSRRIRVAGALVVGVVAAALLIALRSQANDVSTYSTQRALVAVVPLVAIAVGSSLALLGGRGRLLGAAALVLMGVWGALGVQAASTVVARADLTATTPPSDLDGLLDNERVRAARNIAVEGLDTTPLESILMAPTVLLGLTEGSDARTSYPDVDTNEWGALDYMGIRSDERSYWSPDYDLVVSRLGVAHPGRREVGSHGVYRVFEPAPGYDVTVTGGVGTMPGRIDWSAAAWLQRLGSVSDLNRPIEPLSLWVRADDPRPAFVRVKLSGPARVAWRQPPAGAALRRRGEETLVCAPVPGSGRLRTVELPLLADVPPPSPSSDPRHPGLLPSTGAQLVEVAASARPCA